MPKVKLTREQVAKMNQENKLFRRGDLHPVKVESIMKERAALEEKNCLVPSLTEYLDEDLPSYHVTAAKPPGK